MTRKVTSAQLDEIEAAARAALIGSPQGWTAHPDGGDYCIDTGGGYLGGCPDCGVRPGFDEEDATHIAAFDPPTALALIVRLREAEAKVERVEVIHRPMRVVLYPGTSERVMEVCAECRTSFGDWRPWPCPTIRALDAS